MKSYKELIVWQKSVELVIEIYKLTDKFPESEIFGLSSQMRRAAISIPSNIAEGYSRKHDKEFYQFIKISFGPAAELETQMIIANKLGMVNPKEFELAEKILNEILRMLNKLSSVLYLKR